MERAHAIEKSIKVKDAQVIYLYTLGKNAINGSLTISNKAAFSIFFGLAAVFFFVTALIYGCRVNW
jgi:hypothetical protein